VPNEDGAVIFLSEDSVNNDGETFLVPFYVFAERIARSTTTNIEIFVMDGCYKNDICRSYSSFLRDYLWQMFPRATTTSIWVRSSEESDATITLAEMYARMLLCSHLICVTGDMECALAASIKQGGYSSVLFRKSGRVNIEQVFQPNYSKYLLFIPTEHIPTLSFHKTQKKVRIADFIKFAHQSPPDISECSYLRGRVGKWVQDMRYAEAAQYKTPISYYAGKADRQFVPTNDQPYRLPTTYKWVDTLNPGCQTELVSLEGMCAVLQHLGLGRIFFAGDSLTWNHAQSMHKLLGASDDAGDGISLESWVVPFNCKDGYTIQVQAARNDELSDVDEETKCDHGGVCMPWVREYVSNPVPTLLVANTGAHIHDIERFRVTFDSFLETIDKVGRPDDIVYFRTSVPGHRDCMKEGIAPFNNFREYQARETKKWNWNMFVMHNDYVDRTLNNRNALGNGRIHIRVLDVYPITVLRPDGHASSLDCQNQCDRQDDCLHYSLPGPADWWSHLLYSNLLDVLRSKRKREEDGTKNE